ncbi:MAG: hypothetical protein AVDCRST_MAG56-4676 [uncultured Cytophagales bacterium]|uniref:Uncharacterized protein n=1 Tax=uncultured Cytophagales bacterium TaxID=158755 RepID=A0A6J4JYZ8_9SPHI|nr:MAG: hypothetical protein AVDCRST_MAG56-4676 [uncultured Cytophagales bacterium]
MNKNIPTIKVQILDPLEGVICTFSCKGVPEGETLLQSLIAQPENASYILRLLGADGACLQQWPQAPKAAFNPSPVKTPELYRLFKQMECVLRDSKETIALSETLCDRSRQLMQQLPPLRARTKNKPAR